MHPIRIDWLYVTLGLVAVVRPVMGWGARRAAIDHIKTLSGDAFLEYIEDLGRKRDFDALESLYNTDICKGKGYNSQYAATVYCRCLDPDQAVAFCARLQLGSGPWIAATLGLLDHPKEKVIGYLKQIVTSKSPSVRCYCYMYCSRQRWNDLVGQAKLDLGDHSFHGIPGSFYSTVGDIAQAYIDRICPPKSSVPIPPRP
jgi:hypothetical protein